VISVLMLTPYAAAHSAPSPNHDARRAAGIEGIVLHATADNGDEGAALAWLRSPKSAVSCHLFVARNGEVTRLVGDQQRAWHAGHSWWRGTTDVNSITLGIEIANRNGGEPYTAAQYLRLAEIVAHYVRQGLPLDDVVSHQAISTDRATDPVGWDWARFRALVQEQLQTEATPSKPRVTVLVKAKPKSPLCSRTVWLNGLTVLVTGTLILGEVLDLAFSIGITLPQELTVWALFAIGVVNIILRFHTSCPLGSGTNPGGSFSQPSIPTIGRAAPTPSRWRIR